MKKTLFLGFMAVVIITAGFFAVSVVISNSQIASAQSATSVSPSSGSVGDEVTITGSGFGADCGGGHSCNMAVGFGGAFATNLVGGRIQSWSDSQIVVTIPTGATTDEIVITYNDIASGVSHQIDGPLFTVTESSVRQISSISPTSGEVGTLVTIEGSGFANDCGSGHSCNEWVYFGSAYATNHPGGGIESWSDSRITVYVPEGATTAPIKVAMYSDSNGIDPGGEIIQYEISGPTFNVIRPFTEDPVIDTVSPSSGPFGTEVTIDGSNFGSDCGSGRSCNMAVGFGDASATNHHFGTIISWTDSQVKVTVPNGATTAPVSLSMYYDANDLDPGGVIQYSVAGPVFTVAADGDEADSTSVDSTTETAEGGVLNSYGCDFSTSVSDSMTVRVAELFDLGGETDEFLSDIFLAYKNTWGRYARCDELQFHLDHSTPITTLQGWLNENVSRAPDQAIAGFDSDISFTEDTGKLTLTKGDAALSFLIGESIVISGVTIPNSAVLISVASDPKIYITNSNNEGFWIISIDDILETGQHTLKADVINRDGVTISESDKINFLIVSEAKAAVIVHETVDDIGSSTAWIGGVVAVFIIVLVIFMLNKKKESSSSESQQ